MTVTLNEGEAAVVRAGLAVVQSQLAKNVAQTFKDAGSFVASWFTFDPGATKNALDKLKQDIKDGTPAAQDLADHAVPHLLSAVTAVQAMLTHIQAGTVNETGQAVDQFALFITSTHKAIEAVATAAAKNSTGASQQVHDDIVGIEAPITGPIGAGFDVAASAFTPAFDAACKTLFGIDDATKKLVDALKWDSKKERLSATVSTAGAGGIGPVEFDGAYIEAFLEIPTQLKAGFLLKTKVAAGLRGDPMMDAIIPGEAKTKDTTPVAIKLDTVDALTFGDGPDNRLPLPVRIAMPGVELREFEISRPAKDNQDGSARMDFTGVIAAKIGPVLAVVVDGGGVSLKHPMGQGSTVVPKRPDGLGFRVVSGPIRGGGFLRYRESEEDYGGIVDLAFGPIDLLAMAIWKAEPQLSFVTVIGTHFVPKVELSFGFTLNGVGGLLAYNRTLSIEKLTAGLKDGVVSNLLFPDDPVARAPTILNQMASVFPVETGTFVFGPMVDLGWGSQTGIVRAKIGVMIVSTEPQVLVLGSAQVQVPPPTGQKLPKIVDLKLDLFAVISADQVYVRGSLAQSQLAGITVSGDFGMLMRWSGDAEFAISAGGFFPKYPRIPKELDGLSRLLIPFSPPVKGVKLTATGYFALTTHSVQVGGEITLDAKLGPVHGVGHFGIDALFEWSPSLHFVVDVHADVKLSLGSHTIAGVGFKGHLEGTTPWRLSGNASVEVLWWSIDFDLGPYTWGESAAATEVVSALDAAVAALGDRSAWTARTPPNRQVTYHAAESGDALLVDPRSVLVVQQTAVPFDTHIDRMGGAPTIEHQLAFDAPTLGGKDVAATGHLNAPFATGQFLNLTKDEQLSRPSFESLPAGVELAPATGNLWAGLADAAVHWETIVRTQSGTSKWFEGAWDLGGIAGSLVSHAPVVEKARQGNPYGKGPKPKQIASRPAELRQVVTLDHMTIKSAAMPASAAARVVALAGGAGAGLQTIAAGVTV